MTNPRQALIDLANELLPSSFDEYDADPPQAADWYAFDADARLKTITEALTTNEDARNRFRILSAAILAKYYHEQGDNAQRETLTLLTDKLSNDLTAKDYTILVIRRYHGLAQNVSEQLTFHVRGQNPSNATSLLYETPAFTNWFKTVHQLYQTEHSDLITTVFEGKDVILAY